MDAFSVDRGGGRKQGQADAAERWGWGRGRPHSGRKQGQTPVSGGEHGEGDGYSGDGGGGDGEGGGG